MRRGSTNGAPEPSNGPLAGHTIVAVWLQHALHLTFTPTPHSLIVSQMTVNMSVMVMPARCPALSGNGPLKPLNLVGFSRLTNILNHKVFGEPSNQF